MVVIKNYIDNVSENFPNHLIDQAHPYNKIGDGPEGPEVRTIVDHLHQTLKGHYLTDITCNEIEKYFKNNSEGYVRFRQSLPLRIQRVFCKGKHIYFHFVKNNNENESLYLYSHLRMTGRWCYQPGNHTRLTLGIGRRDGNSRIISTTSHIYYEDPRGLGAMAILEGDDVLEADMDRLGPDILAEDITYDQWKLLTQKYSKRSVISFLMTQECICGIGNYLSCEIMYDAQLRPDRKLRDITDEENRKLWASSLRIIRESYQHGGLTIRDYWDPAGRKGQFPVKVYGKSVDPLENPVEKNKFFSGRTTHWVPAIQK